MIEKVKICGYSSSAFGDWMGFEFVKRQKPSFPGLCLFGILEIYFFPTKINSSWGVIR